MKADLFAFPDYEALLKDKRAAILYCGIDNTHAIAELFCAQGAQVSTEPFSDSDILVCGEPFAGTDSASAPLEAMRQITAAVQSVICHMQEQCCGNIVFVHSPYSDYSVPNQAGRSMLSGALTAYMRALAMQYAKYNIRANSIAAPFPPGDGALMQLLPRAGNAQDLAQAALFLASGMSAFMTGQTLPVNGGGYLIGHNQQWSGG